jgi:hypothetical protein
MTRGSAESCQARKGCKIFAIKRSKCRKSLMNSKEKDESKMRRREETLARRMGEALDRINPHGAEACPDAEVIAAYAEQALGPDETAQWEGHFAQCARCRNILRVLAASAETPLAEKEVAQLGELVSTVRGPVEITGRSGKRSRPKFVDWRARWLAPALGVAAVLAVWFAMRPLWRAPDRSASQTLIAQAPKEEVPPAPQELDGLSRVAPQQKQKAQTEPSSDRSAGIAQSLDSPARAPADRQAAASDTLKKASPVPAAQSPQALAAPDMQASAPAPQARAQANELTPSAPQVPPSTSQTVTVTGAVPSIEMTNGTLGGTNEQKPSVDLPINGRNFQALAKLGPTEQYSALLKAPSGLILWHAGKSGVVQRSMDAGKTWVSAISTSREDWLAGAAVSDTVCWLVGRNGAIARTVDGVHWKRVAPPTQAAAAGGTFADLAAITARDAQTAAITVSDGRMFATADGGKTWQVQ